jgi:TrmH family RNA methyltransferase
VTRRISISSPANARLKALRRLRRRGAPDVFLAEGYRQLLHARAAGAAVRELYSAPELHLGAAEAVLVAEAERAGALVVELSAAAFDSGAGRPRPDGLLAVVERWPVRPADLRTPAEPLLVVADGIERPGNLGTIVRSACAAGADGLLACGGRTSLFHPDVVQGSVGALFRLPVAEGSTDATLRWLRSAGVRVVAAVPGAPRPYWDGSYAGATAIVVGNERTGVGARWREVADETVSIPMAAGVDSLNVAVAAGIVLFEAARRRAAQPAIVSGRSSSSDPRTTSASASASSPGGNDAFGIATTRIPAARALRMPLCESSTAAQRSGATPRRRAASR